LPVASLYGALLIAGLVAVPLIPQGRVWADAMAVSVCGFAIGGLLVFLAGLIAIDISPGRSAGAAMGMMGLFSYSAAASQNWLTGTLLEVGKTTVDDVVTYDFAPVFALWIGAAVLSLLLTLSLSKFGCR